MSQAGQCLEHGHLANIINTNKTVQLAIGRHGEDWFAESAVMRRLPWRVVAAWTLALASPSSGAGCTVEHGARRCKLPFVYKVLDKIKAWIK